MQAEPNQKEFANAERWKGFCEKHTQIYIIIINMV